MYPRPEDRFIIEAMALGGRLGLFDTDVKEQAVRKLLIEMTKIPDFTQLLPLGLSPHVHVPSYFEPPTGHVTFHDLLCLRVDDPKR